MSGWPFRFVHASDFHLELPLFGVTEVPPHLRELFLEAPFEAARRVFDAALAEEAEFLVLSGDLLNPFDAGPRGLFFLRSQFERLQARGIQVYWATGRVDSADGWPTPASLPSNVHLFPRGRAVEKLHQREGHPLARLVGASRPQGTRLRGDDFFVEPDRVFSIAVAHGPVESDTLARQGIDYWALGGEHAWQTITGDGQVACYCGSPQGRQPAETGPHGCVLVHVDDNRGARTKLVETDLVRWCDESVCFDAATRRNQLEEQMRNRLAALRSASPQAVLLVSWHLRGDGPLLSSLRHGALGDELLFGLRADFGQGEPTCWSVDLAVEAASMARSEWYDEDTILGEFLRRIRHLEENPHERLDLERLLGERQAAGTLAALLDFNDPASRREILHRATLLGIELLRGDETTETAS